MCGDLTLKTLWYFKFTWGPGKKNGFHTQKYFVWWYWARHWTQNHTLIRALAHKESTSGVLLVWYIDSLRLCSNYVPYDWEYCCHNFYYSGLLEVDSIVFSIFILFIYFVHVLKNLIIKKNKNIISPFDYCNPVLSVEITCWPISPYPDIRNMSLSLIQFDGRESCYSITFCLSFYFVAWNQIPNKYPYYYFFVSTWEDIVESEDQYVLMESTGLKRNIIDWKLSWMRLNEFEMLNQFELMKITMKTVLIIVIRTCKTM